MLEVLCLSHVSNGLVSDCAIGFRLPSLCSINLVQSQLNHQPYVTELSCCNWPEKNHSVQIIVFQATGGQDCGGIRETVPVITSLESSLQISTTTVALGY